jgi:hypothetical protein
MTQMWRTSSRMVVSALSLGLALTVAGCGSTQGAGEPGGGASSGSAGPPSKPSPRVVAVTGYYPYDQTHLAIGYATGLPACSGKLTTPRVVETANSVTVTLRQTPVKLPPNKACPDIAALKSVPITLKAPLGDRVVRDGSIPGSVVHPASPPGSVTPPQ